MSKTATIDLARLFACDLEGTTLDRFYDDIVDELGTTSDWLTVASIVTGVAGQAVYDVPALGARPLAVLYDDRELFPETRRGLETLDPQWRDREGPPRAYLKDTTGDEVTLYPKPTTAGSTFVPLFGNPLGQDYPGENVVMIHTEARTDTPEWMRLWIALEILAREFAYDSDHRDPAFATSAKALANLVREVID